MALMRMCVAYCCARCMNALHAYAPALTCTGFMIAILVNILAMWDLSYGQKYGVRAEFQ